MTTPRPLTLDDRYLIEEGDVYLTGLQALVRLPIDQARRDRRAGIRAGTFVSGYPGSPLGGYDIVLQRAAKHLSTFGIVHVPGANEELAATAIMGTQMLDQYPHSRFDGVVGLWYGKGPGVDRSGDALKHGNFAGTSRQGAVVVLSGEDHEAKSSTVPYQDDYAFVSAGIPIVYPATSGEFLQLGLHAIAMSRFSGCWAAMKLVAPLADGGEIVEVSSDRPLISLPELAIHGKPFQKSTDFTFFPGLNIETERRLYYERHPAVLAYARHNHLNRIEKRSNNDRLGIITAGKSYSDLRQALGDMRLDDGLFHRLGVRLLRVGLIYPLDSDIVREFAAGLSEIIVIEEKRGFLETQVKEALCGVQSLRVLGKVDEEENPFFPIMGGLDSDLITERIGPRLLELASDSSSDRTAISARLSELRSVRDRRYEDLAGRAPNYCSGCPHNISTRLLEDQIAWGSPGCHSFAAIIEQPQRHIVSMTQLGGEGLPWIGLAPFTDRPHMIQNVGDGALFHSSYLNIRFCVATGVNITFKILYNGYVANTGAQEMVGGRTIPELTRLLETEGVKQIAVLTKDPDSYRLADMAATAHVHPVEQQDEVMKELAQVPGVTVFIYDGVCANEQRRRQKRGKLAPPNRFILINEEVCENCGHCGELTNCMSLHKVDTELGPKTQIHASSCNQDYSCLGGDCPSFVTVETKAGTGYFRPTPPSLSFEELPEPECRVDRDRPYHVYIPGVGGTGVITVNALLCYAALMDGKRALSFDQTGAAQKWGPVLSSLVIGPHEQSLSGNKVGVGKADLYLVFDLLAAGNRANLDRCDPQRTAAVVNTTLLPSGEMIRQGSSPPVDGIKEAIARFTKPDESFDIDGRRIAETLFGDYMATNLLVLGVAYQAGLLPLSAESVEAAIRLNRVQVEQNLQAFRYGRLAITDPERIRALVDPPVRTVEEEQTAVLQRLSRRNGRAYQALLDRVGELDDESLRMLRFRIAELIQYQNARYAEMYVRFVCTVAAREEAATDGKKEITHAVIRYLYKLMAYKDEYEVARLFTKPTFHTQARSLFTKPVRFVYNLHPPLLRSMGLEKKMEFGPWFKPVMRMLRALRRLRGTPLDLFGYAAVRREERHLIDWYRAVVEEALVHLDRDNHHRLVDIAQLPEGIRGYESIKLNNVQATKERAERLMSDVLSDPALARIAPNAPTGSTSNNS